MDYFVVDTSSLIYLDKFNPRVFKSLWNNVNEMVISKSLFSVGEVQFELNKVDDRVSNYWNDMHNSNEFFINPKDDELNCLPDFERFEVFQRYGRNQNLWADPHLIAFGITKQATVITQENLRNKPERKIPFICEEIGVNCINFDDFMISQGWEW